MNYGKKVDSWVVLSKKLYDIDWFIVFNYYLKLLLLIFVN